MMAGRTSGSRRSCRRVVGRMRASERPGACCASTGACLKPSLDPVVPTRPAYEPSLPPQRRFVADGGCGATDEHSRQHNLADAEHAVALLVDKAMDSLWMVWIKWGGAGTCHEERWYTNEHTLSRHCALPSTT